MKALLSILLTTAIFTFIFYFATGDYFGYGLAWFDFILFTLLPTFIVIAISPNHRVGRGRGMVSIANRNTSGVLWLSIAMFALVIIFLILKLR